MNLSLIDGTATRVPRDNAAAATGAVLLPEHLQARALDGTQVLQNRRLDKKEQACPTPCQMM